MRIELNEVETALIRRSVENERALGKKRARLARRLQELDATLKASGSGSAAAIIAKGRGLTIPEGEQPTMLFGQTGATLSWQDPAPLPDKDGEILPLEALTQPKHAPTPRPVTLG